MTLDPWMLAIFSLICLSIHPPPSFVFLSISLPDILLFNKIYTIDFGIWSHLQLNLGRNISQ